MNSFAEVVDLLLGIINSLIPLIFAITLVLIIWKITKAWIIDGGDPNSIESGKQFALVGVIALVFMSALWGFIRVLQSSLGLN